MSSLEVLPCRLEQLASSASVPNINGSFQEYTSALSFTSSDSDTEFLENSTCIMSTPSKPSLTNGGYRSHTRISQSQNENLPDTQTEENNKHENETRISDETTKTEQLYRTDVTLFSNSIMKHVKFSENQSQQIVPAYAKPKILIKLMRASSSSTEKILEREESIDQPGERTNSNLKVMIDKKTTLTYTPEMTRKRVGYLQRVREMFMPRSSISLNNLSNESMEESISRQQSETSETYLRKTKSQTFVSDNHVESLSHGLTKSQINEKLYVVNSTQRESETRAPEVAERCADVKILINQESSSEKYEQRDETLEDTDIMTSIQVHKPERTYSLLRRTNEQNDSSHVNFTRIPSLRIRKVHLCLLHHFTTILPPDETDDNYVVKEATNIQLLDSGESLVADILSNNIILFDIHGYPKITFSVESGCEPWATCLTPDGGLAVTLKRQGCVSLWSTSGEPISEFGQDVLSAPAGILCDQQGRYVVVDEQSNSVLVFNSQGEYVTKLTQHMTMSYSQLTSSTLQNKYESSSSSLSKFSFNHPRYICITSSGNYIVADSGNHCIKVFGPDMNFKGQFGCYGRGDGHFRFPYGVASDDDNFLYVADHFNNRVSLFSPDGEFIEHLLTAQDNITRPKSVAVKYPLLYVTHGNLRSNQISVFKLIRAQH